MADQFISIPTMIRSRFRMLPDAGAPRLYTGVPSSGSASLLAEMPAHTRQNDAMLRLLTEMDRKLDAVIGMLQRDSLAADFPHEGHVVRIGGSGLALECRQPLRQGEHMELLLSLEEFPLRLLSVIARVEGVSHCADGSPGGVYSMSYDCGGEENRESLIRFVFSEQRRHIRRSRSGDDD
jgi:hypothetical protein